MNPKKRLLTRFLRRVHEQQRVDFSDIEKMGAVRFWWASRHLRRKQRAAQKEIKAFQAAWQAMTPHQQLAGFIDILQRHPEARKSLRQALGIETTQIVRPGLLGRPKTSSGLVIP